MSTAVMIMMLGLFAIPWTVAGVIHPAAVWMKGVSRWQILLRGCVTLTVLLVIAGLLSGTPSADGEKVSTAESALGTIWLLTCIAWPFVALVLRLKRQAADIPARASGAPVAPEQPSIELSIDECQFESELAHPARPALHKPPAAAADTPMPLVKQAVQPPARRQSAAPKAPQKPPVQIKPAKPGKPTRAIRNGWKLCEVEFMYEDAKGDTTFRMVTVHWVGDSSFKGECQDKQAERTFRLDRVIGDITDTETGEMLDPEDWAEEYR